ncbi:MAG: T9SS type A sorting domain-containing protein, partial [Candidatus Coatesbacteria bacterium]|nr:T9SS type A sorting domain-containing protein [Candidatus Coatesbacteria bacterium]
FFFLTIWRFTKKDNIKSTRMLLGIDFIKVLPKIRNKFKEVNMKVLLLLSFLLPSLLLGWEKYYGDTIYNEENPGIIKDKDGNFTICEIMQERSEIDNIDISLFRIDKSGSILFKKDFNKLDTIRSFNMINTTDGSLIIVGTIKYRNAFGQVYLMKVDKEYNELWSKVYGSNDYNYGISLVEADNGDIIIIGSTFNKSESHDIYLLRTDSTGNIIWEKQYANSGLGHSSLSSISKLNDGGFITAGSTRNNQEDTTKVFLMKIDSEGNIVWEKMFGDTGNDIGECVEITNDGGFIITGDYENELCLLKTNADGIKEWEKTFKENDTTVGICVKQDENNDYIVTGWDWSKSSREGFLYLLKTDNAGNKIWSRTYGEDNSAERGVHIIVTSDGYYIAGDRYTETHGLDFDIYLVKTDKDGETGFSSYVSTKSLPTPSLSISPNPFSTHLSVSLPSSGAVYSLTGQFIMNLSKGKHSLDTSKWREGVYIVKSGKECKRIIKIN